MTAERRNTTPVDKLTPETAPADPRVFTTHQEFLDQVGAIRTVDELKSGGRMTGRLKSTKCSSATCKRIHDTAFKLCPDCRGIRYRYKRSEKGRAKTTAYRQTERHKLLHRAG